MAGTIMSFENCGKREVGYWIGDEYWGKDLATEALSEFLVYVEVRHPLQTGVAKHNIASVRVSEKCGFVVIGEGEGEYVLKLAAD